MNIGESFVCHFCKGEFVCQVSERDAMLEFVEKFPDKVGSDCVRTCAKCYDEAERLAREKLDEKQ